MDRAGTREARATLANGQRSDTRVIYDKNYKHRGFHHLFVFYCCHTVHHHSSPSEDDFWDRCVSCINPLPLIWVQALPAKGVK